MKQICAKCMCTNVEMKTDGRSSSRIEQYVCKDCKTMFFAKRPTRRVRQADRERQEQLDRFAGMAMAAIFIVGFDGSFQDCAMDAYDMAEKMLHERQERITRQ